MPGKGLARLLDPLQVPNADAVVGAARDNHGSSFPFRYRQRSHRIAMPGEGLAQPFDPLQLPDADTFVVAAGDNHGSSLPFCSPSVQSPDRYAR